MASLKRIGVTVLLLASVVLAILVGKRVSPDAAAMLLGVVAGFAASLPVGLLVVLWIGRRARSDGDKERERPAPPVVIVASPGAPEAWPGGPPWASLLSGEGLPEGQRRFVQDDWAEDDRES